MNTQSNAIPGTPVEAQGLAQAVVPESRLICWSVKRELWENRSIYIAPLAVAGLRLVGFLISTFRLPGKMRAALALDPMQLHELLAGPYDLAALLIMGTTFIVAVFYCLDALHGERRDRSILFWKSLPVSDLTTVLSKASIPVVLPLLTFVITVVTQCIMLLMSSAVLLGNGLSVATLWTQLSLPQTWLGLLYHLVTVHSLWYAPIFCWLLLVSAWARRMAILWAGVPVLAIALVEKIAFNTTYFAAMLGNRIGGGAEAVTMPGSTAIDPAMTHLTPAHFVISPGLWIGLVIAAAFLAGAIRLRRSQGPI
jgi:ABC-2 type transport system permease protein